MGKFKRKWLLFIIFVTIIAVLLIYHIFMDRVYFINPEERLLSEFQNHRVIMLGDFCHEAAMPQQSVISFLKCWIKSFQLNTQKIQGITLVLENNEEGVAMLKQYFYTGEFKPLSKFVNCSLERLEFYSDLRKIYNEINKLNGTLNQNSQIVFDIIGPEESYDYNGTHTKMSLEDGFKWFVNERDKLSSNKIINYCKKNPSQKILIFYGNAHLNKKWTDKNEYYPQLGSLYGFYMAHYLSEALGDKEVLTVNQESLPDKGSTRLSYICDQLVKPEQAKNVYFLHNSIENAISSLIGNHPHVYDATILRREILVPPHWLGTIMSKTVVDACILRLQFLETHKGFLAKSEYDSINNRLIFSTMQEFQSAVDWKTWWSKDTRNPMLRLDSDDFADQIVKDVKMRNKICKMIGIRPEIPGSNECSVIRQKIKILNCIGINFVGDASEKIPAVEYLIKQTTQNFPEPADYLKFWRKSTYKVDY